VILNVGAGNSSNFPNDCKIGLILKGLSEEMFDEGY